jgi:hypothetical protein
MLREQFVSDAQGQRDFIQRYIGTYGWYPTESGKKILVYLEQVVDNQLRFKDVDGTPYRANADTEVFFEFVPLKKGLYNRVKDDDVICVQRRPQRQWQRGVTDNNTNIISLRERAKSSMNVGGAVGVSFEFLQEILKDREVQAQASFFAGERKNVALNRNFAIIGGKVFVFTLQIGTYKDREITLKDAMFAQEIADLIRDKKFPVTVKVE